MKCTFRFLLRDATRISLRKLTAACLSCNDYEHHLLTVLLLGNNNPYGFQQEVAVVVATIYEYKGQRERH